MKGTVVAIDREEGGVIYCRRVVSCFIPTFSKTFYAVTIQGVNKFFPREYGNGGPFYRDRRSGGLYAVSGKRTGTNQRWCLG